MPKICGRKAASLTSFFTALPDARDAPTSALKTVTSLEKRKTVNSGLLLI